MNSYFDDLYNDVYEYAYDTITEKKNPPKRGGGKKKLKPKIKTKLKHKKRKLLLLITAMIAAFVIIKKTILNSEHQYEQRTGRERYKEMKDTFKKRNNKIENISDSYGALRFYGKIDDNTNISVSYCDKMIKELTKDKNVVDNYAVESIQNVRNMLIIEKRLKNPLTKLLDSHYLTPTMRKRLEMACKDKTEFLDEIDFDKLEEIFDEVDE